MTETNNSDDTYNQNETGGTYSIITNYGCHWLCPYCIVRNNHIGIPETDEAADTATVRRLADEGKLGFLSLSGGGDPMFRADRDRLAWYREIGSIVHGVGAQYELHTSYKRSILNREPVDFDRIVYHCMRREQLRTIRRVGSEIVRAVFVVQDFMDEDYVRSIADEVKASDVITELSFRQRIGKDYQLTYHLHDFLKAGHRKDWWYIQQGDYNHYIVNGRISDVYEDFVDEDAAGA